MRVVIQRVLEASVKVNDEVVGNIDNGLLVFAGYEEDDNNEDIDWIVRKIMGLRIFNDAQQIMNLSIVDTGGNMLVISQFTLHASTKKGNRPSYIKAAKPQSALIKYESTLASLSEALGKKVERGIFGADMKVSLINDGPVTIVDQWINTLGVRYFNELTNTAILMEEVGEVARLMARMYGEQSFKNTEIEKNSKEALADELADVFFVLICIANQTGINLETALEKNLKKKSDRDNKRHFDNIKLK